jgi:hypothetical protein
MPRGRGPGVLNDDGPLNNVPRLASRPSNLKCGELDWAIRLQVLELHPNRMA